MACRSGGQRQFSDGKCPGKINLTISPKSPMHAGVNCILSARLPLLNALLLRSAAGWVLIASRQF